MQKAHVERLIEESLKNHPDLFLIELDISPSSQIRIVLDGDHAISVKDCMKVSREVEQQLDREKEDFSIEVTSVGITAPLQLPRQYKKNEGRKIKVLTDNKEYKGKLVQANDDNILLTWKQREPKLVGKGKHTVEKEVTINYHEIKEAKVIITFN